MIRSTLLTLTLVSLCTFKAFGQMDTLFYDSFDDNRNHWPEYSGEKGSTTFSDGQMHVQLNQRKGSYQLLLHKVQMTQPDTFMVEVKLKASQVLEAGIVYDLNYGLNGNRLIYEAMTCFPKGVRGYQYQSLDNRMNGSWFVKDPSALQSDLHFRVEYKQTEPKRGYYRFLLNGKLVKAYEVKSTLTLGYLEMGMVFRGPANISVDHFLLMAKQGSAN